MKAYHYTYITHYCKKQKRKGKQVNKIIVLYDRQSSSEIQRQIQY